MGECPLFSAFGTLQLLAPKEDQVVTLINSPTNCYPCEASLIITAIFGEFTLHLEGKSGHTSFIS